MQTIGYILFRSYCGEIKSIINAQVGFIMLSNLGIHRIEGAGLPYKHLFERTFTYNLSQIQFNRFPQMFNNTFY